VTLNNDSFTFAYDHIKSSSGCNSSSNKASMFDFVIYRSEASIGGTGDHIGNYNEPPPVILGTTKRQLSFTNYILQTTWLSTRQQQRWASSAQH